MNHHESAGARRRRPVRRRPGRPLAGRRKRVAISFKVDPDLLETIRARAARLGIGYQTLIHELIARGVAAEGGRR